MIRVVVSGACGKMGKNIIKVIHGTEGIELSGGIEYADHPLLNSDAGECAGIGKIDIPISSNIGGIIENTDVVIDFSSPHGALENLKEAVRQNIPVVIGTTGFSEEQKGELCDLAKKIPCVLSPNMGIGINVMCKILRDIAPVLGDDFDVEIIEAHHRLKKDAPSGTALRIAQVIADALKRDLEKVGVYSRKGLIGERAAKEIGIQTIRAGDIVGEHTVIFAGIGERLEIIHRAQSRETFAKGAVCAAKWIVGKPCGVYDMQDVLGIR